MKKEYIEKYGNDLVAYDSTDTYKPLVICYLDDEYVLVYDVNGDRYNLVKHSQLASMEDSVFTIKGRRYHLSNFVRVDSHWGSGFAQSIEEWKKQADGR